MDYRSVIADLKVQTLIYLLSAYNLTILTAFLLTDLLVLHLNTKPGKAKASQMKTISPGGYRCPQLVSAVDYNPLFMFLLSNLATGIFTNSTIYRNNNQHDLDINVIYRSSQYDGTNHSHGWSERCPHPCSI